MRKATIAIIATIITLLASLLAATPSQAGWDWGRQAPQATQVWDWGTQAPASADVCNDCTTTWKLGGRPNSWTICIANGVGQAWVKQYLEHWDGARYGFRLKVSVLNRCDGYSITNRATFYTYYSTSGGCAKYGNTHRTYDSVQQKEIWDQNVIVYVNVADACTVNSAHLFHNAQMYMGYIMGLKFIYSSCACIMGATTVDRGVTDVDLTQASDMNVVYG